MWIITSIGFFSIVQKPWDKQNDTLTIRARVYDDLVRLRAFLPEMGEIIDSEGTDYRYRSVAARDAVMAAMAKLATNIDYDNFKDEVAARDGYERASVYGDVWAVLYGLQRGYF